MKNRIRVALIGLFVVGVSSLAALMLVPDAADASPLGGRSLGRGYFTNAGPQSRGFGSVIVDGVPASSSKAVFISSIKGYLANGGRDRTGASFIIQLMRGNDSRNKPPTAAEVADWEARINNPAITISVQNYSYGINSGYMRSYDDAAFYDPANDTRLSLVFRSNGVIVFAIKIDCANPLDRYPGLPNPVPPNRAPSGSASWSCRNQLGVSVTDPDNPARAYADVYVNGVLIASMTNRQSRNLSNYTNFSAVRLQVFARDINSSGARIGPGVEVYNQIIGPCIQVRCGSVQTTPLQPEPNNLATVRVNVNFTGISTPPTEGVMRATVTGPSGAQNFATNAVPPTMTFNSQTTASAVATTVQFRVGEAGNYAVQWTYTLGSGTNTRSYNCGSNLPVNNTNTFRVAYKPFFEVNGGDIAAGVSFSDDTKPCSASPINTTAGIVGWNNRTTSPAYAGSGSQYGAFATNFIQDFITNKYSALTPARNGRPTGLAFANVNPVPAITPSPVNPATGMYGGMFGTASCVDYWGDKPDFSTLTSLGRGDLSKMASGVYAATGDVVIPASAIGNGRHITIYVDGNVAIKGSIKYRSSNWLVRSQIPSFKLIVKGSIFIDPRVSSLDGLYVAVPDATSTGVNSYTNPYPGTISSCSESDFKSYDPNQIRTNNMYNACNNQLVVNGTMIANQLWLLRTQGSVSGSSTTAGVPAEVFNYTPEMWLSVDDTAEYSQEYQSVIGLPPVL